MNCKSDSLQLFNVRCMDKFNAIIPCLMHGHIPYKISRLMHGQIQWCYFMSTAQIFTINSITNTIIHCISGLPHRCYCNCIASACVFPMVFLNGSTSCSFLYHSKWTDMSFTLQFCLHCRLNSTSINLLLKHYVCDSHYSAVQTSEACMRQSLYCGAHFSSMHVIVIILQCILQQYKC